MPETIRILLADDHRILRDGIRSLLEEHADLQVIGEAEDGRAAVELTRKLKPDLVLMDIAMPLLNGIEATRQIKRDLPETHILMLTMSEDESNIRRALAAGAMGYMLKDCAAEDLIAAIHRVACGESVLSPAITRLVIEDYLRWADVPAKEDDCLTGREREVLQLIAEGYTNKEIGEILSISDKTVKAHRGNLMSKLDLHDTGELIKYAIQKKIIEI